MQEGIRMSEYESVLVKGARCVAEQLSAQDNNGR